MKFVSREFEDKVEILTLNRPERRNALGEDILSDMTEAVGNAAGNKDVNVIVLAGNGPGFSAGADLKDFSAGDINATFDLNRRLGAFVRSLALVQKPIVCAVDGFALGGGFMLAVSCDVVVTGPLARWHLPEVSLGWLPGFGLETLAARVGPFAARSLSWSPTAIDGVEAHRLGLADMLSPPAELARETALRYARGLAAMPPHAVLTTKQFFSTSVTAGAEVMDDLANRSFAQDFLHETARANLNRFLPRKGAGA
ncbi:enoyl-CoA hydratase/isomerase family protein [Bradyrhizobium sp. DOA9]|uniref:enoyl-CoA hydratase/isomerase family protein n=1 Tax=Bradyrhizobium sp. DOA9 TaxID=1126627 RepID=UPI00046A6159|nr:enoyl-CoA hydratase/isomerase family protein [Bradyrhizobium sp. DOA9]GAJ37483.1 3-hydroxybutyryl-CoA dehydratase [Bradyrhizobium sp. DOA9]